MNRTIQPGATDKVEVVLTTARRTKIDKQIRVTTNDRQTPSATLHCVANVRSALKMTPNTINLGIVRRDTESVTKTVAIERGDGGPISPEVRSVSLKNITTEMREIEPGEKYELDVTVSPPWPNKWLRGTIALNTGVKESGNQVLMLRGQIPPRLTASPSQFTLPNTVEEEMDRRAKLVWSDNNPGRITAASVNDAALSVEVEEQNGEQWVVLHVPAGYKAPPGSRKKVSLRTDDREVPKMDITVYTTRAQRTRTIEPRQSRAVPAGTSPTLTSKGAAAARAPGAPAKPAPKQEDGSSNSR